MSGGSPPGNGNGRHPALVDAREALELAAQLRELDRADPIHELRKAVLLAPTLDICEALLTGEKVPLSQLDPVWVRRYGLR